jgi:probable selenium-dependent hydroxylase accessory protein YqeC
MKSLYSRINIELWKKEMICLVGAGGKTSTMFRLAEEFSSEGRRVLATTTTAIFYPERDQYDQIVVSDSESLGIFDIRSGGITVFGKSISPEGKLLGANPEFIDAIFLKGIFDYIIVEGDGSKGRPIKAPAEYEPVIPSLTTKVLGVIGLDSIGKKICKEYIHRPEHFCEILGCHMGDIVDTDMIARLIDHEAGLFKDVPASADRYIVLNKADGEKEKLLAAEILHKLSAMESKPDGIIITSMKDVKK